MTKPAPSAAAPATPAPAARAGSDRGERTREQIVRATLEIIAAHGLSGVSHRAIAARAGVRLSLTSYHFGALDDLLEASFDAYHGHTQQRREALVAEVDAQLRGLLAGSAPAAPALMAEALAGTLARYIHAGVIEHRTDLAVECNFLFAWDLSPALRRKVEQHSKGLVQLSARVFAQLGSKTPDVDSALLLACIRQLEFTQVSTGEATPVETLKLILFRLLLGLLLAMEAAPPV